jgi:hypothetical protein
VRVSCEEIDVKVTRRLVFALTLAVICPPMAWAASAPQTSTERRRSQECWHRAEAHEGDVFTAPLKIFAAPDADVMAVSVDQDQWRALPRSERLDLMRDLACSYASGRMARDRWQPFGAVDAKTNKTIDSFTVDELYSQAGRL